MDTTDVRSRGRVRARRAVQAELAAAGWNPADLAKRADLDPGTVDDFVSGDRWIKIRTQGRIEQALGWAPGTMAAIVEGEEPPAVGAGRQDDDAPDELRFRRPPDLSDAEWARLRTSLQDYLEFQIERAARDR